MASFHKFAVLREQASKTDDADWVGGNPQTLPADTICAQVTGPGVAAHGVAKTPHVQFYLEWINAVGGAAITAGGRGTFDAAVIVIGDRSLSGPKVAGASSVVGSTDLAPLDEAALTGQIGYRPILGPEMMLGDKYTVRITNATNAGAAGYRIFSRVVWL